ncbi:MAG: TetR/AcrR family transcriptional regulator, regulator of cefoperazone and chloramphenicol, partial [Candidatus Hydrogenedentes bacterium]|nr:TetR/AcrR family transcriptional regulator, regulator of cefoperazone and chloramphenicol [Candidatus Hydrogenedentota bacterium]
EVLREIVKDWFVSHFSPAQPLWIGRVLMRSLLDPTPSLRVVVEQIFEPDHDALRAIISRARPDLSEEEARLWAFTVTGQIAFYEFCRTPVLMILGQEQYDPAFLDGVAEHVASLVIAALGLPQAIHL